MAQRKKSYAPMYLYRTNRDGSLSTVVRRKDLPHISMANLVLSRPKLPDLNLQEAAEESQETARDMMFHYPYKSSLNFTQSPQITPKQLQKSPMSEKEFNPRTSLRDKNFEIVEKLELSRQNYDILERRKWRTEAPSPVRLHPSFAIQPIQLPPAYSESAMQTKVLRRKGSGNDSQEALKDLGFEDSERVQWRLREKAENKKKPVKVREYRQDREQRYVKFDPRLYEDRGHMTKAELRREEAVQYLQEEFRQILAAGYFNKLKQGLRNPADLGLY